jgi:glycosyltransferase involved in cell wall biosynthesis
MKVPGHAAREAALRPRLEYVDDQLSPIHKGLARGMASRRALMLVSARVDRKVRREVAAGLRPMPEYLVLEERYGLELLDWTQVGISGGHRSVTRSMRHVIFALKQAKHAEVILADGEHLGIPLALTLRALRINTPQLAIGHNLLNPAKTRLLRCVRVRPVDRFVTHSANQVQLILAATGLTPGQLAVVPYGIDTAFWSECPARESEGLVVSAGREHRDYRTLVAALPPGANLTIADHSLFTPHATRRDPEAWPPTVQRVALDSRGLRDLYSHAEVVVVPVIESSMPAGITTLLEAMSMGKAVIATETSELRGVVRHGETGLVVKPGDVTGMRAAIEFLLSSAETRRTLGWRARQEAVERYDVKVFADNLAAHLGQLRSEPRRPN